MSTFAVISDPHITVPNPETGWFGHTVPNEPTMYAHSVELLATTITEINALPDVDFVLVAGDLTSDTRCISTALPFTRKRQSGIENLR